MEYYNAWDIWCEENGYEYDTHEKEFQEFLFEMAAMYDIQYAEEGD